MTASLKHLEKQFYSDGYRLGAGAGPTKEGLFSSIRKMYLLIDEFNQTFSQLAKAQNHIIACTKGCEWCCHQPVFALSHELDYLEHYIITHFSPIKRKVIQAKSGEKVKKLNGLKNNELLNSKFPCPLLENGVCIAYDARPVACRIYLSSDVKTCLKFYQEPEEQTNYPALLRLPMRAGKMMNEGFKAALKINGLISTESRIEEKLENICYSS